VLGVFHCVAALDELTFTEPFGRWFYDLNLIESGQIRYPVLKQRSHR